MKLALLNTTIATVDGSFDVRTYEFKTMTLFKL